MIVDDVRQGWRRIRANLGVASGVAVMLGLGIGMSTAMFTVMDALVLRPVPFGHPEQLAQIYLGDRNGGRTTVRPEVFRAWQSSPAFLGVEGLRTQTALIDVGGDVIGRESAFVSPGLFNMLGVGPLRGRLFLDGEGQEGTDDRVVISEQLWREVFFADPDIVGRRITIDSESLQVIGILSSEVRFPVWNTQVWRPLDFLAPPAARAAMLPNPYARFSPDVPDADARRIAAEAAHAVDLTTAKLFLWRESLAGFRLDAYSRRSVPMLAGGVLLVALVLCANASSLLLARLTTRRREFGVCSALGASRGRLVQQTIVEQVMLGTFSAAFGAALAWVFVAMARAFLPDAYLLRTLNPLNLDVRSLGAGTVAAIAATLVAGVAPAWIAATFTPASSIRAVRGGTASAGARRGLTVLLVGEVALACTLLVGATLLVRSFINLSNAERGLNAEGVVTGWIAAAGDASGRAPATATQIAALSDALDALRQTPGIRQVVPSIGVPPGGGQFSTGDWRSDVPDQLPVTMTVESSDVPNGFFDFYDIALLRGRLFEPGDTASDVIVGERLAAALWPGLDPVGRSFSFLNLHYRVIGVVEETHHPSLDPRRDLPEFYRPFTGSRGAMLWISARCQPCPDFARLRQRLRARNSSVQVYSLGMLDEEYEGELARPRAAAALAFVFAFIGVLASASGLFGVLTYAVGQRRREFGIRTALGATPYSIRSIVFRDGGKVAAAGIVLGMAGAWFLTRALAWFEYGVTVTDPVSAGIVLLLLTATMTAAAWRPANQAMRADPVALLRDE